CISGLRFSEIGIEILSFDSRARHYCTGLIDGCALDHTGGYLGLGYKRWGKTQDYNQPQPRGPQWFHLCILLSGLEILSATRMPDPEDCACVLRKSPPAKNRRPL